MSRVTPTEVREVVATELTDPVVQVWIDGAHSIVNANADCIGDDEALLTQIELFLSAHFVGMLNPETRGFITKDSIDGFETTYSNPVKLASIIDNTPHGTTANMLAGGCLTSTTKQAAKLFSLGGSE